MGESLLLPADLQHKGFKVGVYLTGLSLFVSNFVVVWSTTNLG